MGRRRSVHTALSICMGLASSLPSTSALISTSGAHTRTSASRTATASPTTSARTATKRSTASARSTRRCSLRENAHTVCAQAWQEVPEVCQVRMPCRLQVGWPQVRAQGDQVCGEGVQGQEAEVPQRVQGVPARVQVVWVQVRDREGDVRGEEVPAWLFRKLRQVRAGAGEGVPLRIQVLSALMGSSTLTPFGRNWILTLSLLVTFLLIINKIEFKTKK